jgi:hypothetical protein
MLHPTSGMGEFLPLQRGRRSRITTPGQKRMANPAAGQEIAPREPHSSFLVNPKTKNWYGRHFHADNLVTFGALDDTKNERLALQDADDKARLLVRSPTPDGR